MRARLLVVGLAVALLGCPKKKGATGSDGGTDANAAAAASASAAAAAAASASAAAAVRAKQKERVEKSLLDIKTTVGKDGKAKKTGNDPGVMCEGLAAERPKVTDPELVPIYAEIAELCAFEVPLHNAAEALDQNKVSASQASVLLSCKIASRELAKARAKKSRDKKLQHLEHRYRSECPG